MSSSMWPSESMMGWPARRRTSALLLFIRMSPLRVRRVSRGAEQLADDLVEARGDLLSDDGVGTVEVVARDHNQRDVGQTQDLSVRPRRGLERFGDERHAG